MAIWLRFHDEVPRFGSGVRPVIVNRVGPKWVHLISPYNSLGTKLPRAVFDAVLKANKMEMPT